MWLSGNRNKKGEREKERKEQKLTAKEDAVKEGRNGKEKGEKLEKKGSTRGILFPQIDFGRLTYLYMDFPSFLLVDSEPSSLHPALCIEQLRILWLTRASNVHINCRIKHKYHSGKNLRGVFKQCEYVCYGKHACKNINLTFLMMMMCTTTITKKTKRERVFGVSGRSDRSIDQLSWLSVYY